jgi:hypothetical protein
MSKIASHMGSKAGMKTAGWKFREAERQNSRGWGKLYLPTSLTLAVSPWQLLATYRFTSMA